MGVEWAKDGTFCAGGWFWVIYCVDEEGQTKDIGEEDEFLGDMLAAYRLTHVRKTYMSNIGADLPNLY